MAGQGTIATELLNQVPQLDAIFVPVSGGGMAAGIAVAAKAIKPDMRINYHKLRKLHTIHVIQIVTEL